jgi:hypothetical protein
MLAARSSDSSMGKWPSSTDIVPHFGSADLARTFLRTSQSAVVLFGCRVAEAPVGLAEGGGSGYHLVFDAIVPFTTSFCSPRRITVRPDARGGKLISCAEPLEDLIALGEY